MSNKICRCGHVRSMHMMNSEEWCLVSGCSCWKFCEPSNQPEPTAPFTMFGYTAKEIEKILHEYYRLKAQQPDEFLYSQCGNWEKKFYKRAPLTGDIDEMLRVVGSNLSSLKSSTTYEGVQPRRWAEQLHAAVQAIAVYLEKRDKL